MIKRFQNIRYKYKLLISMVAVFLIPCFFISLISFMKIQEIEKNDEILVSKQLFQQSIYNMNIAFEEVQKLSYQFLTNKNLKSVNKPMMISEKRKVWDTVSEYILNSTYIEELCFYSEEENMIIFSQGTIDADMYFDSVCKYEDFCADDFFELDKKLNQPLGIVMPVKRTGISTGNFLTIFVPLSGSAFQMAIFQINMKEIIGIADELINQEKFALEIYFNKKIIYSNMNDGSVGEEWSETFPENAEKSGNIESVLDRNDLTMLYTSEDSLLMVLAHRKLFDETWSARSLSFLSMIFSLIVMLGGCIVVIFFWKENYKPVGEILDYCSRNDLNRENEFDIVKNTLLTIQSEKEKMSQSFNDSIPAYQKHILTSLIKGEFADLDELNAKGCEAGIMYHNKNLFILAVSIVDADKRTQIHKTLILEKILSESEEKMSEKITCHGFVDMMDEKIIYVANTDLEKEIMLNTALLDFQRNLQESLGFELNIGCSNMYQKMEDMSKAYMEALSALDYRIVYGYGKIIYFSQISLNNYSHNWYPEELTRQFRIALKTRDEEQVHENLDEIMEYLHRKNTPVYVAKYVCYDLMQMLANSLVVSRSLPYKKTIGYHNIMNIARVSTFEQITEILHQNVNYVLSMDVKEEIENTNHELKERLEQFIEKNYSNSSFSMASLVEEFGVSESTMRKNFKAVMQTTFIEYLAEKRIEKSKDLLSTTDYALNQIAQMVGYLDTSSFIRRFRQKTGMPPGEYRMLHTQ